MITEKTKTLIYDKIIELIVLIESENKKYKYLHKENNEKKLIKEMLNRLHEIRHYSK